MSTIYRSRRGVQLIRSDEDQVTVVWGNEITDGEMFALAEHFSNPGVPLGRQIGVS